jgi:hypothetical protein
VTFLGKELNLYPIIVIGNAWLFILLSEEKTYCNEDTSFLIRDDLIPPSPSLQKSHELRRYLSRCNRLQLLKPYISPQSSSRTGILFIPGKPF